LKEVPFGHWIKGDCPKPPIPAAWEGVLLDALAVDRKNEGHCGFNISATSLLTCPRQLFIDRLWDRYINPSERFSAETGGVFHDRLAQAAIKYGLALPEKPLGPIWLWGLSDLIGAPIHMTPDLITPQGIEDYKFTNPTTLRYLPSDGHPDSEHEVQWSLYWHGKYNGVASAEVPDPSGFIWYVAMMTGRECAQVGGPWLRRSPGLLSVQQIADFHPHEGMASCTEIGKVLVEAFKEVEAGQTKEEVLSRIPLFGLSMMVDKRTGLSNKCLKACGVRDICIAHGGGHDVQKGKAPVSTSSPVDPGDSIDALLDADLSGAGEE
jgi:hypothetical protein